LAKVAVKMLQKINYVKILGFNVATRTGLEISANNYRKVNFSRIFRGNSSL